MNLYLFRINSSNYKLDERENFYFDEDFLVKKFSKLKQEKIIQEVVFINTCYRIEYYIISSRSSSHLLNSIFEQKNLKLIHLFSGLEVINKLFRLVSGLDSPILGENEVFFQVKKAYKKAFSYDLTGKYLNQIFQKSFYVGKKVRTETQIAKHSISIFGLILNEVKKYTQLKLEDLKILLIGSGELAQSLAFRFYKKDQFNITMTSRRLKYTKEFANSLNYQHLNFDELEYKKFKLFNIIISCMGNAFFYFNKNHFEKINQKNIIMVFDLAMPRNFNTNVENLPFIHLKNIDEILNLSSSNYELRKSNIYEAEQLIKQEFKNLDILKYQELFYKKTLYF